MLNLELAGNTTRTNVASGMIDTLLKSKMFKYGEIRHQGKSKIISIIILILLADPTKDNFTEPLSIKQILDEFEFPKDDHNSLVTTKRRFRTAFEKAT